MLTYFPKQFATRGIICYFVTLILVSAFFLSYALPFQFMLFGMVPVILFFTYSSSLTRDWQRFSPKLFTKKLFTAAVIIRITCVVFLYFYFISTTGRPFKYGVGDDTFYADMGELWRTVGFEQTNRLLHEYADLSDRGYCWWLSFEGLLLGTHVLPPRIVKCFIDAFSCVLIYNLGKRNFGEYAGRIAAVFCMMMPNMWYYCGVTLKETEMAFMVILFVERGDLALRSKKITIQNLLLPAVLVLAMFTFRTALAGVMVASLVAALIFSSGKQLETWKKVLYTSLFAVWMFATVGSEIIEEARILWEGRADNQEIGYQWRAETNSFAKYASASVFAPLIFTIPFSSMVATPGQENMMMMNGANFIKNVMSGFTIFALILLLIKGDWRKHVLPITTMCGYMVVLVFSNFAHSERFHFPVLALELLFAAYGVTLVTNKHKRWYMLWIIGICIANIAWAYVKLVGRGYSI